MNISRIYAYITAIAAVVVFGILGTLYFGNRGGFNEPITSVIEAAYFTIATVTTVGYGDLYPITNEARLFVIVLIVVGIGIFFGTIVAVFGEFMESRIESITGRMSAFERRALNKHVILEGSNTTNLYLAEKLAEKNERFIIVTADEENVERLQKQGFKAFAADATSEVDMKDFEPKKAKAIVIDMQDSSRAIYALLVAKEMAGQSTKIVVMAPTKTAEHHMRNIAGGKALVVNPSDIAASNVSDTIFK
jgi:voltage-gated potassium channel